jgi:tRNA-dihydrouridine synthase A
MKTPEVVINCMKAMKEECKIPVTVKCRLGVDDFDSYEYCSDFIKKVSEEAKVDHFIMHARKAHLKGIFP